LTLILSLEKAFKLLELNYQKSQELGSKLESIQSIGKRKDEREENIDFSSLSKKVLTLMLKELETEKDRMIERLKFVAKRMVRLKGAMERWKKTALKRDSVERKIAEFHKMIRKSQSLREIETSKKRLNKIEQR
jgi:hypothetical protein